VSDDTDFRLTVEDKIMGEIYRITKKKGDQNEK